MKAIVKNITLQFDENKNTQIVLTTKNNVQAEISKLKDIIAKGKELSIDIKQFRHKRSLDANSYSWVLIDKIAKAVNPPIPEEEVYIEMLKRYGQREPHLFSIIAEGVDMVYRATKNHCCEVGESELNGKLFKHIAVLRGSSTYNTKEMSVFIDGIIQDAKELDIETKTPQELESMKNEWGR